MFSLWRCPPLCLYPSPQHLVSIPSIANFLSIKLTQTNYLLWKTKKISFIEAQDLLSFVDGTGKEPKEFLETDHKGEIMNPEYVPWRRTDRLLKSLMMGTMTEDVLSLVVGLRTSRNIWMCLEKTFAQSSKDRELQLQCQLQLCPKRVQNLYLLSYCRPIGPL